MRRFAIALALTLAPAVAYAQTPEAEGSESHEGQHAEKTDLGKGIRAATENLRHRLAEVGAPARRYRS